MKMEKLLSFIGTFTNHKDSDNPYKEYYGNENLFDKLGMSLACQSNVGYCF